MSNEKCNEQVFKEGSAVAVLDIPKEKAESLCLQLSLNTDYLHDWYYAGGRVVVKAIKHSDIKQNNLTT